MDCFGSPTTNRWPGATSTSCHGSVPAASDRGPRRRSAPRGRSGWGLCPGTRRAGGARTCRATAPARPLRGGDRAEATGQDKKVVELQCPAAHRSIARKGEAANGAPDLLRAHADDTAPAASTCSPRFGTRPRTASTSSRHPATVIPTLKLGASVPRGPIASRIKLVGHGRDLVDAAGDLLDPQPEVVPQIGAGQPGASRRRPRGQRGHRSAAGRQSEPAPGQVPVVLERPARSRSASGRAPAAKTAARTFHARVGRRSPGTSTTAGRRPRRADLVEDLDPRRQAGLDRVLRQDPQRERMQRPDRGAVELIEHGTAASRLVGAGVLQTTASARSGSGRRAQPPPSR